MLRFYLLSAFRVLKRNKWITLINIVGLSVGMALFLIISLFVSKELTSDKYHRNLDRIARLETDEFVAMPMKIKSLIGDGIPEVEKVVRISYLLNQAYLRNGQNTMKVNDLMVADPEVFDVFSFQFISGNPQTALADPRSVVLTASSAKKFFGDSDPVGKSLRYNDQLNLTVTGVINDLPSNSSIWAGIIGSTELFEEIRGKDYLDDYNEWSHYAFVMVREGASIAETSLKIHRKLNEEIHQMMNAWFFTINFKLTPMSDIYFGKGPQGDSFNHGSYKTIIIYSSVALFILLIAIINFVNLSNATAFRRSREIGLKKISGADKSSLLLQLLIESVILSLISICFAFVLFDIIYPVFNHLTGAGILPADLFNLRAFAFAALFALFTGVLSGIWPAFFLINFQPVNIIKGSFSGSKSGILTRRILLVFQFLVAVVLIVVTIVIQRQMSYARDIEVGFNKENIIYFPINGDIPEHRETFATELRRVPGVAEVSFTSSLPGFVNMSWGPKVNGETRRFDVICCDASLVNLLNLSLVEGRNFHDGSLSEVDKAYIVNETFVKSFDIQQALGEKIIDGQIVGVVKDFSYLPVNFPLGPLALAYRPSITSYVAVMLAPGDYRQTIASIEKVWNEYASAFPFEITFMDEAFDKLYKKEERLSRLFGYFSVFAVIIACMGVAGLSVSTMRIKSKEISVRRVFGASVASIVVRLTWDYARWLLLASVLAYPLAWYFTEKWLSSFAYHIDIEWWMFILSTIIAGLVVISVVLLNTIRNVKQNPLHALSWE